jgi:hypothetical protein
MLPQFQMLSISAVALPQQSPKSADSSRYRSSVLCIRAVDAVLPPELVVQMHNNFRYMPVYPQRKYQNGLCFSLAP